jgi:predicted unusual protein kinase regulating ubiquinone biosynthesis (AarF/ABC1/UbiB family)
LTKF